MKIKKGYSLEDLLKPTTMTCGRCGGELIVHPYLWQGQIKSINWCVVCSIKKEKPE